MLNEIEKGSKIIFVDEAIFSPATMFKRTWSLPNDNVKIIDMRDKVQTQAIIAGISIDKGLESYLITERSIKSAEYIKFMRQLRKLYPKRRLVMFVDNLMVHKSREVKPVYEELDIYTIFCAPYSP